MKSRRELYPNKLNIEMAVRMYYENYEIERRDVEKIFGISISAAQKKMKEVKQAMIEESVCSFKPNCIPTVFFYKYFNLDITDLENRLVKISKLKAKGVIHHDE